MIGSEADLPEQGNYISIPFFFTSLCEGRNRKIKTKLLFMLCTIFLFQLVSFTLKVANRIHSPRESLTVWDTSFLKKKKKETRAKQPAHQPPKFHLYKGATNVRRKLGSADFT